MMHNLVGISRVWKTSSRCVNRVLKRSSGTTSLSLEEVIGLQSQLKSVGPRVELHLPKDNCTNPARTLALLFGWTEARLKTLAKFSPMYTSLNIPCVCIAPSVFHMWYTVLGNELTARVIDALGSSVIGPPISLVLHIFSSGSNVAFPKLVEYKQNPDTVINTKLIPKCVAFDSAPAVFSYDTGTAAAKLMYKQGQLNLLTYQVYCAIGATTNFLIGSTKRSELKAALNSNFLDIPQLYLYSKADTVSRSEFIDQIIKEQAAMERVTRRYCWNDSEHVRHFSNHPEVYVEQITSFLNQCNVVS